jgi:hypothetical protein
VVILVFRLMTGLICLGAAGLAGMETAEVAAGVVLRHGRDVHPTWVMSTSV